MRNEIIAGWLGAVALLIGMFWGLHWLADWLSAEPWRWLAALALIVTVICVWAVIGLIGSLLGALLGR